MTQPEHASKYLDPVSKMLDPRTREIEPAQGDLGFSSALVKSVDLEQRTITAIVSTPHVDRYEEIVEPKAFAKWLKVFMGNPVFIAGHTYNGWSGEPTTIGHWTSMTITDEGVVGTATFATTELAEQYWTLYRDGHMKAFSVGWITHAWEVREFDVGQGVKKKIRVFTEVELIEVSAVAIPANRESLVRAASALASQSEGDHDADQSKAIAKAIKEEISADVKSAIAEILPQAIKQQLSTEPGSLMCTLMQDVVEMCMASPAHGGDDHVHESHDAPMDSKSFDGAVAGMFNA